MGVLFMETAASSAAPARRSSLKVDLGLRSLIPEWRALLSRKHLREDALAGVTVACIALPLSMAIALASGVKPEVGLVTAIVAGIVCALTGGTPLAVSGPAAAMAVLVASIVERHGLAGLLVTGLLAGVMQIATGALGLGRVIRFVPLPVVLGFTAGIGAVILIGQLPRALGLPPPDQDHVLDVILHIGQLIGQTHLPTLALTALTVAIALGLPRLIRRAPAPLIAVFVPTVLVAALGLDVALVGSIPRSLPAPSIPALSVGSFSNLLASAFFVYALASLESLLSSSAVDKMSRGPRHDADQELVGQGLGNIASALFGGIPVTGVIARSSLNVQSGAKTRRSAIIHALVLIASVYVLAPILGRVPIAALAGVLLSLALRMLDPRELAAIWRVSRVEAAVFVITFAVMVSVDLVVGVQAGVLAALAIAAFRFGQKLRASMIDVGQSGPYRLSLRGPVTFLAQAKIDDLHSQIDRLDPSRGVLFDLTQATEVDVTGLDALREFVEELLTRGSRVALIHPPEALRSAFKKHEDEGQLIVASITYEAERALGSMERVAPWDRLVQGVERFREETKEAYADLFERLATSQEPHTLFITCSDSRVIPSLITSTDPGELFIVRNVGNIVPITERDSMPAEGAALEFAVGILRVKQIIVCGHSCCGAMGAVMSGRVPAELTCMHRWLKDAQAVKNRLPAGASSDAAARANVLMQLENLRSYPIVERKVARGELKLYGWFYDIRRAEIEQWDAERGAFVPVGHGLPDSVGEGARARPTTPGEASAAPALT
jgi:carbonic anhydrase